MQTPIIRTLSMKTRIVSSVDYTLRFLVDVLLNWILNQLLTSAKGILLKRVRLRRRKISFQRIGNHMLVLGVGLLGAFVVLDLGITNEGVTFALIWSMMPHETHFNQLNHATSTFIPMRNIEYPNDSGKMFITSGLLFALGTMLVGRKISTSNKRSVTLRYPVPR